MLKFLSGTIMWLAVVSQSVWASQTLWQITPAQDTSFGQQSTGADNQSLAERHLQAQQQGLSLNLDLSAIDAVQPAESVQLALPGGPVAVQITTVKQYTKEIVSLSGYIRQDGEQYPVVITRGPKGFFARIVSADGTYVVRGMHSEARLFSEATLQQDLDFSQDDALVPPELKKQPQANEQVQAGETYPPLTDESIATIDFLMLYSPAAAAIYNGDIATRLYHLVSVSNQIYRDSGVFVEMRLAAMREVALSATESHAQLDEMTDKTGAFADLDKWRYEAGADMVALLTPMTSANICGLGWYATGPNNGGFSYNKNYMVSLTHITCSDYVLAHEAGHNMGLAHSERQGDTGYSMPFARGYGVDRSFATVMAYESYFSASKIYQFSNPAKQCKGQPCGIDRHDEHGADATYAINAIRHGLARQYQPGNLVTFSDALLQVTDPVLKQCLQQIKSANPTMHYAGQLTEFGTYSYGNNCAGLGSISSLAGLEQFSNISRLYLSGQNISDFSPLASLRQLQDVTLSGTASIALSWLANLPELTALTLYNYTLNDLTPLAALPALRELELQYTKIASYQPLSQLSNLRVLYISHHYQSPDNLQQATWLSGMNNLTNLTITTSNLSDLNPLSSLVNLTHLQIGSSVPLTVDGLSTLTRLQYVYLSQASQLDCDSAYRTWRALIPLRSFQLPSRCKSGDTTAPVFAALPIITMEATGPQTKAVLTAPTATDAKDGSIPAWSTATGSYAVGDHQIDWRATDFDNNTAVAYQTLRVQDTTAPVINGPDVSVATAYSTAGITSDSYEFYQFIEQFTVADLVTANIDVSFSNQSPWAAGAHLLTLSATDQAGNSTSRTVYMLVNFAYGPKFTVPAAVTLPAPGPDGLSLSDSRVQQLISQLKAHDYFANQPLTIRQVHTPARLKPGKNILLFEATDQNGYTSAASLVIYLTDQSAPVIQVPAPLQLKAGRSGIARTDPRIQQFLNSVTASDNFDSSVVVSHDAPEKFLPGVTVVHFSSTDSSGNQATAQSSVEILLNKKDSRLLQLLLMAQPQQ